MIETICYKNSFQHQLQESLWNELNGNQFYFQMHTPCINPYKQKRLNKKKKLTKATIEIDVKPKQKLFKNEEEKLMHMINYTLKIKTELCKNFMLTGKCTYEYNCSFAHGQHELQEKTTLHQQCKTKPCQNYFEEGFCKYGIRCQFLHEEIKDDQKFWNYIQDVFVRYGQSLPLNPSKLDPKKRTDIQRFQQLSQKFEHTFNESNVQSKKQILIKSIDNLRNIKKTQKDNETDYQNNSTDVGSISPPKQKSKKKQLRKDSKIFTKD